MIFTRNIIRKCVQTQKASIYTKQTCHANKQFIVVIKDYEDSECLQRRMNTREEHLKSAVVCKEDGKLIAGGAILDSHEAGKMKGSIMISMAESIEELDQRLREDPYFKANVWEKWDIYPFKAAIEGEIKKDA
ncbi:hypothetical protein BDB01DRAFT_814646 [Pilobolus umbonatus]|nr:hypothetical protein BDB01DRAFT_814646 [Pilobolus umbonatus]